MIEKDQLIKIVTNKGNNIFELSTKRPVLLVFLRQFGCIYCREAMNDLSGFLTELEKRNVHLVLVHMSSYKDAKFHLEQYELQDVEQVSDPEYLHYVEFGLLKGTIGQLFGLKVWARGFEHFKKGNRFKKPVGDGFQMPGVFLLSNGKVSNMFVHNSVADKPNYLGLIDDVIEN